MHLGVPQIIYTALIIFGAGISAAKFGEPKRGNFGWFEVSVGPAIAIGLLYWGGFYG